VWIWLSIFARGEEQNGAQLVGHVLLTPGEREVVDTDCDVTELVKERLGCHVERGVRRIGVIVVREPSLRLVDALVAQPDCLAISGVNDICPTTLLC
jgi:hypothetical protein